MTHHNCNFGSGYSTIDVEYDVQSNEITYSNDEYGYYLCLEEASSLKGIIGFLREMISNKPLSKRTLIWDGQSMKIKYFEWMYEIWEYDNDDYNLRLNDEYYIMFIESIETYITNFVKI